MVLRALQGCVVLILTAGALAPALAGSPDDWKAEANARIDALRKRDAVIAVVDELGRGAAGVGIGAWQLRHRFAFGSCVNRNLLFDDNYRAFFFENFEWAVLENESKWFYNEPWRDFLRFGDADAIYHQCETHGIKVRGHCIFWAKEEYTPPWCRSLPDDELRDEVAERLDDAVPRYRGKFLHWDVNNEMLDGDFFRRRLGADIEPWMFVRAHELDPDALLFVNDYSIIAGSAARTQAYINQIRSLQQRGAPILGVGVQGHFWGSTVDPLTILARLDQLSVLDLPVWVTEYDTEDADENGRAEKLENLYRAAFSHPIVDGILMWGFWAGSHWRGPNAAIVDLDWRVNAAGLRYQALMQEWTTRLPLAPAPEGTLAFRGFHGAYDVTIDTGSGLPVTESIELAPGQGAASFVYPLPGVTCAPAGEAAGLTLAPDAAHTTTLLGWQPPTGQPELYGLYDVLRSDRPDDFVSTTTCVESDDGPATDAADATIPGPGSVLFYLVRARNRCPSDEGPLGARSDGTPRAGRPCPP